MINGDYSPTRHQAQNDAVNLICVSKLDLNPESVIGVTTSAGRPQVLISLTQDMSKILSSMHKLSFESEVNLTQSFQIAQLVLKHRQNKHQKQRIIAFVGSPVLDSEQELVQLAKKLKKSKIYVDIVLFGELEANQSKLDLFIATLGGEEGNCAIVTVLPNTGYLSDTIARSNIVRRDRISQSSSNGAMDGISNTEHDQQQGHEFEFGIDPSIDPELAMVLKMSFEEERQRLAKLNAEGSSSSNSNTSTGLGGDTVLEEIKDEEERELTEEQQIELAIQMSLMEDEKRENEDSME